MRALCQGPAASEQSLVKDVTAVATVWLRTSLYIYVCNIWQLFINSYHRLDLTEKEFTVGADIYAAKRCTVIIDKKLL